MKTLVRWIGLSITGLSLTGCGASIHLSLPSLPPMVASIHGTMAPLSSPSPSPSISTPPSSSVPSISASPSTPSSDPVPPTSNEEPSHGRIGTLTVTGWQWEETPTNDWLTGWLTNTGTSTILLQAPQWLWTGLSASHQVVSRVAPVQVTEWDSTDVGSTQPVDVPPGASLTVAVVWPFHEPPSSTQETLQWTGSSVPTQWNLPPFTTSHTPSTSSSSPSASPESTSSPTTPPSSPPPSTTSVSPSAESTPSS